MFEKSVTVINSDIDSDKEEEEEEEEEGGSDVQ